MGGIEAYPVLARMQDVDVYRENGLAFTAAGEGWAELTFRPPPRTHNFYGFVHGGIWLLVADSAMGGALGTLLGDAHRPITTQMDYRWLGRFEGEVAVARGRVLHRGRAVAHCEAEVVDAAGRVVGKGTGTYVLVPEGER